MSADKPWATVDLPVPDNLRSVPKTRALLDQKLETLDPVEAVWLECLEVGEIRPGLPWPGFYTSQDLVDRAASAFPPYQQRGLQMRLAATLKRYLPEGAGKVRRSDAGRRRTHGYHIPPLSECRAAFEKRIGHSIDWQVQEAA